MTDEPRDQHTPSSTPAPAPPNRSPGANKPLPDLHAMMSSSTLTNGNHQPASAADLRSIIFSAKNKQRASEITEFFGVRVEVRQASLQRIVQLAASGENDKAGAIYVLLNYVFVPGTNEPVFTEADEDQLSSLPYGKDIENILSVWKRITSISVAGAEKN
jgi:hypothetical protein